MRATPPKGSFTLIFGLVIAFKRTKQKSITFLLNVECGNEHLKNKYTREQDDRKLSMKGTTNIMVFRQKKIIRFGKQDITATIWPVSKSTFEGKSDGIAMDNTIFHQKLKIRTGPSEQHLYVATSTVSKTLTEETR